MTLADMVLDGIDIHSRPQHYQVLKSAKYHSISYQWPRKQGKIIKDTW